MILKGTLSKLILVPILFFIACGFAGLFGALHNQLSYTVSAEYFTKFKFHQFGIGEAVPGRTGAAVVGWQASWWMGVIIGIVLIPLGLIIPGAKAYFWSMIRVFWIVVLTTACVGLAALSVAFLILNESNVGQYTRYNNEIVDDLAFARAGMMHNFSYLGGMLGIGTGAISVVRTRRAEVHPAL